MYSLVLYIKEGVPALSFNLCWMLNKETLIPPSPCRKAGEEGIFFCLVYLKPTFTLIGIHIEKYQISNTLLVMMITIARISSSSLYWGMVYHITNDTVTST